jgi:hypothetical protein
VKIFEPALNLNFFWAHIVCALASFSSFSVVHGQGMFGPEIDYADTFLAVADYDATKAAVLELFKRFPPSQFEYVGVGKSPTPVIALIKAILGEQRAHSLPLSNMGGFKPNGLDRFGEPEAYTDSLVTRLRSHFDHFLPKPENLNGKGVVIIDFAERGDSLENSAREIGSYYAERFPTATVRLPIVGIPQDQAAAARLRERGFDVLEVEKELVRSLAGAKYKQLHEFQNFNNSEVWASRPYQPPQRRTRENLQRWANREEQNTVYAGSDDASWVRKRKKKVAEGIEAIEGFDTLVDSYQARAADDRKLVTILRTSYPDAALLEYVSRQPPTSLQRCIGFFEKLATHFRKSN